MSHALKMLASCVFHLLLIFLLPLFGISEGIKLLLAMLLIFVFHLLMMRGHHSANQKPPCERGRHAHS